MRPVGNLVPAYILIPLLACVVTATTAAAILVGDPRQRIRQRAALMLGGVSFWAFCEVAWNSTSDPGVALVWMRASSLGWVAVGPLILEILLELSGDSAPRLRRALPWLYRMSGAFLVLATATPWVVAAPVRTAWGFGAEFGPAYPAILALSVGCALLGTALAARAYRLSATSPGERSQLVWIVAGVAAPLGIATVTDSLLPLTGSQAPRFGTASFALLGAVLLWSLRRYGYSMLPPGAFAAEILLNLHEGVALLRLDGGIRSGNPGLARLLGVPGSQLRGIPLSARFRGIDLGAEEDVRDLEAELIDASGVWKPVEVSSDMLRDSRDLPIGRIVVVRDVGELVELRARLVTSARLASVGELAAGIAHEISNPITYVRANLTALQRGVQALSRRADPAQAAEFLGDASELVSESLEGVDRVTGIIEDVKGMAHPDAESGSLCDLAHLLDAALRVASPQIGSAVHIERCFGDVPLAACSPDRMQQVFLNLIINAAQAVGPDGTIRLETQSRDGRVCVRVIDDGCGIPEAALERVFDPFFTTKAAGEGTGLGLAISYQIVRRHGGEIRVESVQGEGTSVEVWLPCDAPAPQQGSPAGR